MPKPLLLATLAFILLGPLCQAQQESDADSLQQDLARKGVRVEQVEKKAINPLFTDMTWGAGGSTVELTLQLATYAHDNGHVSNMHLTCTNMEKDGDPKKAVHEALMTSLKEALTGVDMTQVKGDAHVYWMQQMEELVRRCSKWLLLNLLLLLLGSSLRLLVD